MTKLEDPEPPESNRADCYKTKVRRKNYRVPPK